MSHLPEGTHVRDMGSMKTNIYDELTRCAVRGRRRKALLGPLEWFSVVQVASYVAHPCGVDAGVCTTYPILFLPCECVVPFRVYSKEVVCTIILLAIHHFSEVF
jgi:hypothetical protein